MTIACARGYAQKSIFVLTTNVGQRMMAEMFREGKSVEEVATRMKEARVRFDMGSRTGPYSSGVFGAHQADHCLSAARQGGDGRIARKQIGELCRTWAAGRDKRLEVAAELVDYVGATASRLDEKSGGKEGGRIVRNWWPIGWSPLQRAMAADPDGFRQATGIAVAFDPPAAPPADDQLVPCPSVTIRFE